MSIILMTTLFYKALLLQGEIWRWSLLGFKRVNECHHYHSFVLGLHQNNIDVHLIQYPWVMMIVKMKQESWHKDQTQKFQQWMELIIMMNLQGTPALEWFNIK